MRNKTILLATLIIGFVAMAVISGCKKEATTTQTCTNGVKDGDETGVDCGGSCDTCPVLVLPPPIACFTKSTATAYIGEEIFFTNCSTGGTSYLWDFGDGQTATEFSPSHRYLTSGIHTVTLNASNTDTTVTETSAITIEVNSATYAGNYHVSATCSQSGNNTYDASISPSGSSEIIIYNFYNQAQFVRGAVSGSNLTITNQAIFGITINGTGTLSSGFNTLNMTYKVVGGPTNDNCSVVYTRY